MYEPDDREPIDGLYLPKFATYTLRACGVETVESLLSLSLRRLSQLVVQTRLTEADVRVLVRMLRRRSVAAGRPGRSRHLEPSESMSTLPLPAGGVRSLASHGITDLDGLFTCRLADILAVRCLSPTQIASLILSLGETTAGRRAAPEPAVKA